MFDSSGACFCASFDYCGNSPQALQTIFIRENDSLDS